MKQIISCLILCCLCGFSPYQKIFEINNINYHIILDKRNLDHVENRGNILKIYCKIQTGTFADTQKVIFIDLSNLNGSSS